MSREKSGNTWKRESGFIWSVLGSAIGFANILSFSAQCYRNGGGAFLIPLVVAYALLGIPMLILEAVIGQRYGLPFVSAYGYVRGRPGRTMGWLSILNCGTIGMFYTLLTGYAVAYAFFCLTNGIPADTAVFFQRDFLGDTGSLSNWGSFSWSLGLSAFIVSAVSWYVLTRNVQAGVERVCSLVMPMLVGLIFLFCVYTLFLPGAFNGLLQFLVPDFSRLGDFSIWRDAFGHLFFSLSLGLGIITGYARYNGKHIHIGRAMRYVVLGDISISFLAGVVVFGCLGFLSYESGVAFADLVRTTSTFELGFIVFPKVLQAMGPWAMPVLGSTFFFCLFIAGITGVFSIAESIAGSVEVERGVSRKAAVTATLGCMSVGSLVFCMGNGQHLIDALAPMVMGFNMLLAAFVEVIVFLFAMTAIQRSVTHHMLLPNRTWTRVFGAGVLVILFVIFIGSAREEVLAASNVGMLLRWTWLALALGCAAWLSRRSALDASTVVVQEDVHHPDFAEKKTSEASI